MIMTDQLNGLPIIPLRNGSKGLPDKNILTLAGKPLYRHAVDQALRLFEQCVISTDIPQVLDAKLPDGCLVLKRPVELAQDDTQMDQVLDHVFDQLERRDGLPKAAVLLQATSPLRQDSDITKAFELFKTGKFELIMSVTKTDATFLKYGSVDQFGTFHPVGKAEYCFTNRQALPQMVKPNGAFYVFDPKVFRKNNGLATQSIGATEMDAIHSHDIDNEHDFKIAAEILG